MDLKKAFETNKATWEQKVSIHADSEFYFLEAFKNGKSSLNTFELEALGNVNGKSLLHLQCHFGQDTLSWSRLGAKCTGVDISEEGVKLARALNEELQLDATFVRCNVLDTSEYVTETFDIIFTSYGTIGWLPDLQPWAEMISERLKSGGIFYIIDFHPIPWMFDYTVSPPELKYGYQQKEVIYEEYNGTYADPDANMVSKEYGWNHSLGEVVSALANTGLAIEFLREHDTSPYNIFPGLAENEEGLFEMPDGLYPLLFEIKATKN